MLACQDYLIVGHAAGIPAVIGCVVLNLLGCTGFHHSSLRRVLLLLCPSAAEACDSFSKEDMVANGLASGRSSFYDLVHPTHTREASEQAHAAIGSMAGPSSSAPGAAGPGPGSAAAAGAAATAAAAAAAAAAEGSSSSTAAAGGQRAGPAAGAAAVAAAAAAAASVQPGSQPGHGHDSIEDAATALALYNVYCKLVVSFCGVLAGEAQMGRDEV